MTDCRTTGSPRGRGGGVDSCSRWCLAPSNRHGRARVVRLEGDMSKRLHDREESVRAGDAPPSDAPERAAALPPEHGTLRLCAPRANRAKWRRTLSFLFDSGRQSSVLDAHEDLPAHASSSPSTALLLGPAHFPLREIGAALVRLTDDATALRVHTASALPLPARSTLAREEPAYIVFVLDMTDRRSHATWRETSALVAPAALRRGGIALVFGAEDEASHAFALTDLRQTAAERSVQMRFMAAPRVGAGVEEAATAAAAQIAALVRADAGTCPGQALLRTRAVQDCVC